MTDNKQYPDHLSQKLENIISGHSINQDDADWLRATCASRAEATKPVGRVDGDGNATWFDPIPEDGADLYAAPAVRPVISDDDQMALAVSVVLLHNHRYAACAEALRRVLDSIGRAQTKEGES